MNNIKKLLLMNFLVFSQFFASADPTTTQVSQKSTQLVPISFKSVVPISIKALSSDANKGATTSLIKYHLWLPDNSDWGRFSYNGRLGDSLPGISTIAQDDIPSGLGPGAFHQKCSGSGPFKYGCHQVANDPTAKSCVPTVPADKIYGSQYVDPLEEINGTTLQQGISYSRFLLSPCGALLDNASLQPGNTGCSLYPKQKSSDDDFLIWYEQQMYTGGDGNGWGSPPNLLYANTVRPLFVQDVDALISSYASLHFNYYFPTADLKVTYYSQSGSSSFKKLLFTLYFNLAAQDQGQVFAKEALDF